MQNYPNTQWVQIVAKLTLARSILGSAIGEIDDIASEAQAGRIQGTERSLAILESAIKDLMSSSQAIGDVAVDIPEILLGLNRSQTQTCCLACQSNNTDHILSERTLFDLSQLTRVETSIN